jgi:Protein of unknown function (DUF3386)
MILRSLIVLTGLTWALGQGRVQAHFLFVRITPHAEGGRAAEVYFSELAEAGDPRYIGKVSHTQLWMQRTPGTFEPLNVHRAPDRLRAWVPTSGSVVVAGECQYGVLARPMQTPFMLRHFPKALAGNPDELNKMKPHGKLALEIVATFESEQVRLVALKDGKPVPRIEFITVDAKLANTRLKADDRGEALWKPAAPGAYSVYVRDTRKESGELRGKKYEEIRDFATIAFNWPLERKDADPAAVALFEEAMAARSRWENFPGFTARITGNLDGRQFRGSVTIDAKGEVDFKDDDSSREESVGRWVHDQLGSIVLHRLSRPATKERPKPVLRFGEMRDDHPLGRLLIFDGGKFASSYRIKDRQITVVNRHVGQENLTITTLENDRTKEGQFLPHSYAVQYWEAATGRLLRTETIQDRWQRVGSWDLPILHSTTTASDAGISVRSFTLSKHELLREGSK